MCPENQRRTGQVFATAAWLALLWALAQLILAAVYNQGEELGMGVDSAKRGAWWSFVAIFLAMAGFSLWVLAERRLRQSEKR